MKRKTILVIAIVLLMLGNFAFIAGNFVKPTPGKVFFIFAVNRELKKAPSISANRIGEIKSFIYTSNYNNKYRLVIDDQVHPILLMIDG